ncbi:MAG: DUF3791 domain-containing protein [Chitinispirillales bacterium]|jgi:hypothetical protein|nr:DUF3791 domain-containing protein [Chitinispirillales bacterium]
MENKQEIWTAMILSGYAQKREITTSKAAELLLADGGLNYLEEHYNTLHTLSNEDVIGELIDMSNAGTKE